VLGIPVRPLHRRAEPEATGQAFGVDDVLEVGADLVTAREGARPRRIRVRGEAVEMRGHVARDAGVGVVAPRAADGCGALEQDEVVASRAAQGDRRADACESRADDRDLDARQGAERVRARGHRSAAL
jgi:hypothetical protein